MSRAFIKEDAGDPDELPELHQSSAPNYVTSVGLEALRQKAMELRRQLESLPPENRETPKVKRDLRYFEGRLASAILVDPGTGPLDEVRFGATVVMRTDNGRTRSVAIVGQDEAQGAADKIAWDSALALMGAKKGDRVETEDFGVVTILDIQYPGR